MKITLFLAILLTSFFSFSSDLDLYFQRFMSQFQANSQQAMDQVPPKFDSQGRLLVETPKVTFEQRLQVRDWIKGGRSHPFSEAIEKSQIENFFSPSTRIISKIEQMSDKLLRSTLAVTPWSGDYWPTYRGGIGSRYADASYPQSFDFKDYYSAYRNFLPLKFEDQNAIDNLSPAEKYDILVGDDSFTMTRWTFEDASDTYRANGNKIEAWFGICHGWAPAAFMMSRAEKTVTYQVQNFQGHQLNIKFYPDDVKALSSLLWGSTTSETYFLGGRCNTKNPAKDSVGRITDEDCFDVNPGAWHIAVINQLGAGKFSFVLDASYDYEVWNQPVASYEVSYFHPQSRKPMNSLAEAMIPIEEFTQDKFKSYRSPKARFVVGVSMILSYVVENSATHTESNSTSEDNLRMVNYIYDLELNENGEIIGGEWYQNVHPDFIWSPDKRARAVSVVDRELRGDWSGNVKVPGQWTKSAAFAATYGQPLAAVVEGLIKRAKK